LPSKVFEDASVQTVIVVLQKEFSEQSRFENRISIHDVLTDAELARYEQRDYSEAEKNIFFIVPPQIYDLRRKLRDKSVLLGEIASVNFGLKTGDDNLFLKRESVEPEDKKLISSKDVGRYSIKWAGEFVWYVPEKMREHRATARPGEAERFEQTKIVVSRMAERLTAAVDGKRLYVKDALLVHPRERYAHEYITAILNSKLMDTYYSSTYTTVDLHRNELIRLPIHPIDFSNPIEKAQHDTLVELAQRMLDLNQAKQEAERAFAGTVRGYERETTSLWRAYWDHAEYRPHLQRQPLLDANATGQVSAVSVDEEPATQSLLIRAQVDGAWQDVARLVIPDEDLRLFLFFALRHFLHEKRRKKVWARGRVLRGLLDALQVPVLVPASATANLARIAQLMADFRVQCPPAALHLSELECTLQETDAEIDRRVYDLYGLTEEERRVVEENVR